MVAVSHAKRRRRRPFQYEGREEPLLPRRAFAHRLLRHFALASALVLLSLGLGALGYRLTEGMPWLDAVLNAAMILTGMGPVSVLHSEGAKLFATAYALFSGVVFLAVASVVVAPVAHRLLHRFHLEEDEDGSG
jgi:hypothetical protein